MFQKKKMPALTSVFSFQMNNNKKMTQFVAHSKYKKGSENNYYLRAKHVFLAKHI